jgi:hypothetical protein
MKLALVAAASLAGCTSDSPLSKVPVLVWVNADPTVSPPQVQVEIDPTDDLATLADAVAAGDIHVSLDGRPLVLDPNTGYTQQGGSYSALFDLPATSTRETSASGGATGRPQVLITDGVTTWHAQFGGLFTNDLAPIAPLAGGNNTFEWSSATLTNAGIAEIQSACLEVVNRSSSCVAYGDHHPDAISQQYITLPSDAKAGETIVVTAERWDDAQGDLPQFIARIKNRYTTTQR